MAKRKKAKKRKAKALRLSPLEKKLATVREALLEDLDLQELQRLQVHTDLLENALVDGHNYHHHDTNQHHDHDTLVLETGLLPRRMVGSR